MGQNDIQRGGLNSILRRTLTVKGDLPPSPVVGAEIVPTMPLEVDRPEWGYLNEQRFGILELNPPGAAAQHACGILEVPAGSDLLVVVTKITMQWASGIVDNTGELQIAAPTETLAALGIVNVTGPFGGIANDARYCTNPAQRIAFTSTRGFHGTHAGFPGTFIVDMQIPVNDFRDFCDRTGPFILTPGYKLIAVNFDVNQTVCVCFHYYERSLQPNEKPVGQTGVL